MNVEWDEQKNRSNIRKHGLDFADAWEIFYDYVLTTLDDREDYGEDRWIGIGQLRSRIVVVVYVVVVYAERDDSIRIISLRKALTYERIEYEKALQDQLGSS